MLGKLFEKLVQQCYLKSTIEMRLCFRCLTKRITLNDKRLRYSEVADMLDVSKERAHVNECYEKLSGCRVCCVQRITRSDDNFLRHQ